MEGADEVFLFFFIQGFRGRIVGVIVGGVVEGFAESGDSLFHYSYVQEVVVTLVTESA